MDFGSIQGSVSYLHLDELTLKEMNGKGHLGVNIERVHVKA